VDKTETIRGMIAQRLKAVAAAELTNVPAQSHLDEDVITAFVEGRLVGDECQPVLAHLAACGACRRTSAQMVQMENQIDAEVTGDIPEEPSRLESLISRLGSILPSTGEDVVFAYQNPEEPPKATEVGGTPDEENNNSDEN